MVETVKPENAEGVTDLLRWAAAEEETVEIAGGGSKQGLGRPVDAAYRLDLSGLAGITLYEPEELVLSARAGTPVKAVKEALDQHHQQLAFEPMDPWLLFGGLAEAQTLAGVIACNLAGPRRIKAGAARDHFLGFEAVSGRGEDFKSGGRVVKNVTGYDLCKLIAGSYGTLAALTQVTVKVLPAPERTCTLLIFGQDPGAATAALARAAGSAYDVSALAHLPAAIAARSSVSYVASAGAAVTAVRVEGTGVSATARAEALSVLFADCGDLEELHSHNSQAFWREVRDVGELLADDEALIWKLSVTPSAGPGIAELIVETTGGEAYFDWAGGLIWLALPATDDGHHAIVRAAVGEHGHATLIRAPQAVRRQVPVFQPLSAALSALHAEIKRAFDPRGILNPGRMAAVELVR